MNTTFFFLAFPYISAIIFILAVIFRATTQSYKITSLSSQFLEHRKLFWGTSPFHFGLIFLFFGHLIAFLIPRAVIAWNSVPLRLIILEVSGLGFALAAILGLILLIIRRSSNDKLKIVTSKMDVAVYVILLIQIISGIWIAVFNRWGSNWFASVLTPYLWSIITFSPDATAVATLPLSIKIHIASAFSLVIMIPFSRFFHFLAVPFQYLWRSSQLVIWNYDRKKIRTSTEAKAKIKAKNS